jgi:aspartate aminotransferase-like enzyme
MIKEEGLEACFARHARLAEATRRACVAIGCALFAPTAPSPTVTAVRGPEGFDTGKLVKQLRDKYGVAIQGGQDAVKGKIFRLAHLGYFDTFDIITAVAAVEMALADLGVKIPHGAGVAAAEAVLHVH